MRPSKAGVAACLALPALLAATAPAQAACTIEVGPPNGYAYFQLGAGSDNGVLLDGDGETITPDQPYSVAVKGDCHDSSSTILPPNVHIILHQWSVPAAARPH